MKKVGILTFHWGTNYGAVLQAYALQQFIIKLGHHVQIIDYVPFTHKSTFIGCFKHKKLRTIYNRLIIYLKEQQFIHFRKKYLYCTKRYNSLFELQAKPPQMDVYICGSDQVWNPYFLANGEKKMTPSYFLPFGDKSVNRIAYAVSFGCKEFPLELQEAIIPFIQQFSNLSVREESGKDIIHSFGFEDVKLMPDPTFLLSDKDLSKIVPKTYRQKQTAFFYILQDDQNIIEELFKFIKMKSNFNVINTKKLPIMGIEEWLGNIKNASFVVTNSFHGIVFSILFQKSFVAVPIEGRLEGMNDRIYSLLKRFNLENRIIETYNELLFQRIINTSIDWKGVNQIKFELQNYALNFFKNSFQNNMPIE